MKIYGLDSYLYIDFKKINLEATWSLWVVDDQWDKVKNMVVGLKDPELELSIPGIENNCILEKVVSEYCQSHPVPEKFVSVLRLLPWISYEHKAIGGILFSSFPDEEKVNGLVKILTQNKKLHLAVLIDQEDTSIKEEGKRFRLPETWNLLDREGVPQFVRAQLTRGQVEGKPTLINDIPLDDIPIITKQDTNGEQRRTLLKKEVHKWIDQVRGIINVETFEYETTKELYNLHHPFTIRLSHKEQRIELCKKLVKEDSYGVWHWCRNVLCDDKLSDEALHRWLAAKSFIKYMPSRQDLPLTALIAICAGAKYMQNKFESYDVDSELSKVDVTKEDDINNIRNILGVIQLKSGNYENFAMVLRDWLINEEQFESKKSHVISVRITHDSYNLKAVLELKYSGNLHKEIFTPSNVTSRGTTGRAWDKLFPFILSYEYENDLLILFFAWKERV